MQQTTNYKLNLIETSDPFSPNPLNENMDKVDAEFTRLSGAVAATDEWHFLDHLLGPVSPEEGATDFRIDLSGIEMEKYGALFLIVSIDNSNNVSMYLNDSLAYGYNMLSASTSAGSRVGSGACICAMVPTTNGGPTAIFSMSAGITPAEAMLNRVQAYHNMITWLDIKALYFKSFSSSSSVTIYGFRRK